MKKLFLFILILGVFGGCSSANREIASEEESQTEIKGRGMDGIGFNRGLR